MSMFDIPKKAKTNNSIPVWIINANERQVFEAVSQRIHEIESLISTSDSPLKPSEFKIVKSSICKNLGLSGSYIAKHKSMNDWVDGHQRRLKRLTSNIEEGIKKRTYTSKKPEQMKKDELISEIKKLRKDIKLRNSELYVNQLIEMMNSGLAESQVVIQERTKYLEAKISQLLDTNAELEINNQRLIENLIESIKASKNSGPVSLKSIK